MKKNIKENSYDWTTDRSVYNRLRKERLANCAEIHCSFCGYHRGENATTHYYEIFADGSPGRNPNWKLISKNRKQWMKKPYHPEEDFDLTWSAWSGNIKSYKQFPEKRILF